MGSEDSSCPHITHQWTPLFRTYPEGRSKRREHVSGPVLGSLHMFSHLILTIIIYGRHYYSHSIDDKTEA